MKKASKIFSLIMLLAASVFMPACKLNIDIDGIKDDDDDNKAKEILLQSYASRVGSTYTLINYLGSDTRIVQKVTFTSDSTVHLHNETYLRGTLSNHQDYYGTCTFTTMRIDMGGIQGTVELKYYVWGSHLIINNGSQEFVFER